MFWKVLVSLASQVNVLNSYVLCHEGSNDRVSCGRTAAARCLYPPCWAVLVKSLNRVVILTNAIWNHLAAHVRKCHIRVTSSIDKR